MEDKERRVHDSDLDDDKPKETTEEKKEEEKKKAARKPMLKLDPAFVTDNPRGLKHLYR